MGPGKDVLDVFQVVSISKVVVAEAASLMSAAATTSQIANVPSVSRDGAHCSSA